MSENQSVSRRLPRDPTVAAETPSDIYVRTGRADMRHRYRIGELVRLGDGCIAFTVRVRNVGEGFVTFEPVPIGDR